MKKDYLEPRLELLCFTVRDKVANTPDTDQGVGDGEPSWEDPFN